MYEGTTTEQHDSMEDHIYDETVIVRRFVCGPFSEGVTCMEFLSGTFPFHDTKRIQAVARHESWRPWASRLETGIRIELNQGLVPDLPPVDQHWTRWWVGSQWWD